MLICPCPPASATAVPPAHAPPRPAPGKFPPSAGIGPGTFPQTQIPRCAFSQAVARRCWAADFPPAAVAWGSHPPKLPAPVGMFRRTAEIAPNSWARGSAGALEAAGITPPRDLSRIRRLSQESKVDELGNNPPPSLAPLRGDSFSN